MNRPVHARRSSRGRSRGQALVEFAFVAPIFLLILFATIDFGRYVYYVQVLNNAAREGARYAIVHGGDSFQPTGPTSTDPGGEAVKKVVRDYAVGVIGENTNLAVTAEWGTDPLGATNNRGQPVHVSVEYEFHSLIPVVPIPEITIKGESTLVINH